MYRFTGNTSQPYKERGAPVNHPAFCQWKRMVSTAFSRFHKPVKTNLALFGLGFVLAPNCYLLSIAQALLGENIVEDVEAKSLVERLYRLCDNENFDPDIFAPQLTKWVLSSRRKALRRRKRIFLIVDETQIGRGYRAMVIGWSFGRRVIPLIVTVYRANSGEHYPPEGQVAMIIAMMDTLLEAIPAGLEIILMSDRGIGNSPDLCKGLAKLGVFFMLRIPINVKLITPDGEVICPCEHATPGEVWRQEGEVFVSRGKVPAKVFAKLDKGYDKPWIIITNHPTVRPSEYARRNWIEQMFRDWKSGNWDLDRSRLRSPERLARFLCLMMLATAYALSMGSYVVAKTEGAKPLVKNKDGTLRAYNSLFKEGLRFVKERVKEMVKQEKARLLRLQFHRDPRPDQVT